MSGAQTLLHSDECAMVLVDFQAGSHGRASHLLYVTPNGEEHYKALKRYLLIFIDLIFDSSVDGGMPSLTAAPDGPATRPLVSAKAAPIISRSSNADLLKDGCFVGSVCRHPRENQLCLTENVPF